MTAYMEHKDLANERIDAARRDEIMRNVRSVLDRIAQAETQAGREPGSVTLLAATKTRDVGEILAAIDGGVRLIGENRPQEIVAKIDGLRYGCHERKLAIGFDDLDVENIAEDDVVLDEQVVGLHLIGQLQSNKIGKVVPLANAIESVDSVELAEKLARRGELRGDPVAVLLEVNTSGEPTKSGCPLPEAVETARQIAAMDGIELHGLMTVGAHVDDEAEIRRCYADLRRVRDEVLSLSERGCSRCTELSMGMSGDFETAIEEGATIVRCGTAIFGERDFK